MAQRRMFSPAIVCSDAFLDMPVSARDLYYQLGMRADDDGFVNPRSIMRLVGASEDDLKVLLAKRFVLVFENGVIVIKHWKVNNQIKPDRYHPTIYSELFSTLAIKSNGAYTERFQNGSKLEPQVRLGKVSKPVEAEPSKGIKSKEKPMKKNSMGRYREDRSSDSHEDVVDIETGDVVKEKKRHVMPQYKVLLAWAELRRGKAFMPHAVTYQFKAFKLADQYGIKPHEMQKRWEKLEEEKWRTEGFDWMTVLNSFNKKPN